MKKNHEEIDQLIRKALTEEEAKFYDDLHEQNFPQMIGGLFKGKMRWITLMTFIIIPILFVLAVGCAIRFYQSEDIKEMLIWCSSGFFLLMAISFLKLFNWLQMDKNAIMREIKRMELQVAILNNKLDKN